MKTIKEINIPEIDISEIDAKSKKIGENINYDEVRNRIRQVLDKITDKKNRGKKVSQDTIGKYLFPHLGADSSTQSTMSRFVNGNKNTKNPSDNCPDIKALIRLSQLTGISTDWFLYGENSGGRNKEKTWRDYARLMFIDMHKDFGAIFEGENCSGHDIEPVDPDLPAFMIIKMPISTFKFPGSSDPILDTNMHSFLTAALSVNALYKAESYEGGCSKISAKAISSAINSIVDQISEGSVHDY